MTKLHVEHKGNTQTSGAIRLSSTPLHQAAMPRRSLCHLDASPMIPPCVPRHRSFSARPDPVSARRASGLGFVAQPSNPTVLW
jgi:hypothetical protein